VISRGEFRTIGDIALIPAGLLAFFTSWGNHVAMTAGLVTALMCGLMVAVPQLLIKRSTRARITALLGVALVWSLLAWGGHVMIAWSTEKTKSEQLPQHGETSARTATPSEIAGRVTPSPPAGVDKALQPPEPSAKVPQKRSATKPTERARALTVPESAPAKDTPRPSTTPTTAITLLTLFSERDFPTFFKSRADAVIVKTDGTRLACEIQLYLDFLSKAKFIGVFIPFNRSENIGDNSGTTYFISEYWADHSSEILSLKSTSAGGFVGGEMTKAEDLTFTGRVYIYHENYLTQEQVVALRAIYHSHNMEAQFRGPDYLFFKTEAARK
jgi:hypothetical protein